MSKTPVNKGVSPCAHGRAMHPQACARPYGRIMAVLECTVSYLPQDRKTTLLWANSGLYESQTKTKPNRNKRY